MLLYFSDTLRGWIFWAEQTKDNLKLRKIYDLDWIAKGDTYEYSDKSDRKKSKITNNDEYLEKKIEVGPFSVTFTLHTAQQDLSTVLFSYIHQSSIHMLLSLVVIVVFGYM